AGRVPEVGIPDYDASASTDRSVRLSKELSVARLGRREMGTAQQVRRAVLDGEIVQHDDGVHQQPELGGIGAYVAMHSARVGDIARPVEVASKGIEDVIA